jgi:hypothetical protein
LLTKEGKHGSHPSFHFRVEANCLRVHDVRKAGGISFFVNGVGGVLFLALIEENPFCLREIEIKGLWFLHRGIPTPFVNVGETDAMSALSGNDDC